MEVRRLYEEDVAIYEETLVSLLRSCYDGNYEMPISDDFCRKKLAGLRQYLREGKAYLFGIVDESGRLAGFEWGYEVSFLSEKRYHVAYVAIAPWAAGKGLFTILLRAVEQQVYELGYSSIELAVSPINQRVYTIYQHYGYEVERIYMKKPLTAPGMAHLLGVDQEI